MKPILTFKENHFVLSIPKSFKKSLLKVPKEWERLTRDAHSNYAYFKTDSLEAAARLNRKFADKDAQRIFKKVFNEYYTIDPHTLEILSQLSFLDEHQIEGVKFILSRKRSYLAHAPGAGKTAQAIIAANLIGDPLPTLFIVPPSLAENWVREIRKFYFNYGPLPRIGVVPSSSLQHKMRWDESNFLICPDSMLTKSWVMAHLEKMKFKLIAVDEASRLKNPETTRARAFFGGDVKGQKYKGLFRSAKHVVFLDGSPMPNRPIELWAPIYALDPEAIDCMSMHDFGVRYCGATMNAWGQYEYRHSSNESELRERLKKRLMHVVPESRLRHPERLRSTLYMSTDPRSVEQRKWERQNAGLIKNVSDEVFSQGDLANYRRELGLRKVEWVSKYVAEVLNDNPTASLLVFAWHREVCELLKEALRKFKPKVVMGGTSTEYRERAFEKFQNGECRLIIGNIQAMGRGHNLQRADRVVFAEFSWSPENNLQCEKRASRRGRDEQAFVRCEYVVCPDSLDEIILKSLTTKEKRVRAIMAGV